jgi:hypothetical protein
MDVPDYEIVVSAENSPYLLWQCLLFHASCFETQKVAPTVIVHGDRALLPGFDALADLGARVCSAASYRMSGSTEYICRNTAGSFLEAAHDRSWTLICDPDFLFLRPLPPRAEALCGNRLVSWDFVAYMRVGELNRRWLAEACAERGVDAARVDLHREGGVVPNFVHRDVQKAFGPRWLSATDALVRAGASAGEVPWVTIAWAFALAAWEMDLELALTRLTDTSYRGLDRPESSLTTPILHYCYGDDLFDKRRHGNADSAASVWTLDACGSSVSAHIVRELGRAREWYAARGVDVTDPLIYQKA